MQQKFFELLEEENKKGATVLLSSHILSEIQKLCTRVAVIKEGKIITLDKISTLQENNYKKIKISTKLQIDNNYFKADGVVNLDVKKDEVSFLFKGDINALIQKISKIEINNILVEEPDLEEIFMHFYAKEN